MQNTAYIQSENSRTTTHIKPKQIIQNAVSTIAVLELSVSKYQLYVAVCQPILPNTA